MPLLNLPPAEVRRRRRFVIILFECLAVFSAILNFVLFRWVLVFLSLEMTIGIVLLTFLFLQGILFLTLYIMLGPNKRLD